MGREPSAKSGLDNDLPPDPDLDELPAELREREGPFRVAGIDPDTGDVLAGDITKDELASAFADTRRYGEDDAA